MCADKHSDITKITHLLNQPAVDPNIYDKVYLENLFASIIIIVIILYHISRERGPMGATPYIGLRQLEGDGIRGSGGRSECGLALCNTKHSK